MKLGRRLLFLGAFAALAFVTVLSIDRTVQPSAYSDLLLAAGLAVAAAVPGLVDRRLTPLSVLVLLAGSYALMRLTVPLPPEVDGWVEHYRFYALELDHGLAAYASDVFPLTLSGVPGLRLLVLVWFYLTVGVAAILALGGRRPLLGAGVLLAVLGTGLTVDAKARDPLLTVAFLILTVAMVVSAQGLSRHRWGLRDALTGVGLGAVGVVAAIALLSAQPGLVTGGWQDWREWDPFGSGSGGSTVFNWKQNYPRLLDPGNEQTVMLVTSPLPSYWRATTLETFTGASWVSDIVFRRRLEDTPAGMVIRSPEPRPPGGEVGLRFELVGMTTNYLFVAGRPLTLSIPGSYRIYASDSASLRSALNLDSPFTYDLTAVIPRVEPTDLVGLGREYGQDIEDLYLPLPLPSAEDMRGDPLLLAEWEGGTGSLPLSNEFRDIYALNDRIVGDATDPYQQTLLIEDYLRNNHTYSLSLPPIKSQSPIAGFLFETRTGYCQHFAGAMALLLRLNGIPARVAVGFTTGTLTDEDTYAVSTNNAHAWVEAYFPGVGWLPFDPTPGRALPVAGASSTTPGFKDPFPHVQPSGSSAPLPSSNNPLDRVRDDATTPSGGTASAGWGWTRVLTGAGIVVALAALAAGWPGARRRVRERGLRSGSAARRLQASLLLLRADLLDWGVPLSPASTLEEVAREARAAGAGDLRPVVDRAQAILFGGRPAGNDDVAAVERSRRQAVAGLGRKHGRWWSLLARYGLVRWARALSPRLLRYRVALHRSRPPRPQRTLS